MKKIIALISICSLLLGRGCYDYNSNTTLGYVTDKQEETGTVTNEAKEPVYIPEFDAMFYDNDGNNYVTFRGNNFNITPNKVKMWGYSTDGYWDSWYETSSVVTVNIDGHYVHSCGSTILFKDTRINIEPLNNNIGVIDSTGAILDAPQPGSTALLDWYALRYWWADIEEKGQGQDVIIIIQSQNGDNIGVVQGKDIQWEVAGKLPKTTLITIDNELKLYLHRCNFTIIDTDLFDMMEVE